MTVSMKSAQISQAFAMLHHSAYAISTRTIVRNALRRYQNTGNNTIENWSLVEDDLLMAASAKLGGFHEILQIALFDTDVSNGQQYFWAEDGTEINGTIVGNATYNGNLANGSRVNVGPGKGSSIGLLNITGDNAHEFWLPAYPGTGWTAGPMKLPLRNDTNASAVAFWSEHDMNATAGEHAFDGFPRNLYPIRDEKYFSGMMGNVSKLFTRDYILQYQGLLLGPTMLNDSCAILSLTFPVFDQNFGGGEKDLVGFATIVLNATSLVTIVNDNRGIGDTGQTLLVGPNWINNLWNDTDLSSNKDNRSIMVDAPLDGIQPTILVEEEPEESINMKNKNAVVEDFPYRYLLPPKNRPELINAVRRLGGYPAVRQMFLDPRRFRGEEGKSDIDSINSEGDRVGVGFALPPLHDNLADWGLIIEQTRDEAFAPIKKLEKILLAAVFGTFAAVLGLVWPIAHFSVRPIARLKVSTQGSGRRRSTDPDIIDVEPGRLIFLHRYMPWIKAGNSNALVMDDEDGTRFRIPEKIPERRHIIFDELTE